MMRDTDNSIRLNTQTYHVATEDNLTMDNGWQIITEPRPMAAQHILAPKGREVMDYKQEDYATSRDAILKSKGFQSCQAVFVHNKGTGETTIFHVYQGKFSEKQEQELARLHAADGEKFVTIVKGNFHYVPSRDDITDADKKYGRQTVKIIGQLAALLPEAQPQGVMVISSTHRRPEIAPSMNISFDAKTGETLADESIGDGPKDYKTHRFQLFAEQFAARNAVRTEAMKVEKVELGAASHRYDLARLEWPGMEKQVIGK